MDRSGGRGRADPGGLHAVRIAGDEQVVSVRQIASLRRGELDAGRLVGTAERMPSAQVSGHRACEGVAVTPSITTVGSRRVSPWYTMPRFGEVRTAVRS